MLGDYLPHLRVAGVPPAGLDVAQRPAGRDIAAAGEAAELAADLRQALRFDEVDGQVAVFRGDGGGAHGGEAQIKADGAGVVKVHAEALLRAGEQEQVVGRVQAGLVFGMAGVVEVPGAVAVAALVDAADRLAQTEDHVVLRQREAEGEGRALARDGEVGQGGRFRLQRQNDRARGQRTAVIISANHDDFSRFPAEARRLFLSDFRCAAGEILLSRDAKKPPAGGERCQSSSKCRLRKSPSAPSL